jgi:hypothetical protein
LDDLPKIAEEETPMLPETEGAPSLPFSGGGEPEGS